MVLDGMVTIVCMFAWVIGKGVLFMVDYDDGCGVVVLWFSRAAIWAQ